MEIIRLHLAGFLAGFILDLIVGDPHWFKLHQVRMIGALYSALDKAFLGPEVNSGHKAEGAGNINLKEYSRGLFTVALAVLLSILSNAAVLYICFEINRYLFIAAEAFLSCTCISTASLVRETSPVKKALGNNDLYAAREKLSYVVGRDTDRLKEKEIINAVIETLAENLSDGIISPIFYLALFGPCGGMAFKAVSTGDSMIGYKNKRYFSFGRAAAKLDDILNFIPARITAALIIFLSIFSKRLSAAGAYRAFRRDHRKTESPNAGCPESAVAGALGIELGGSALYGGVLIDRPQLGENKREATLSDISITQRLVISASVVMEIICVFVLYLI
ncbi:MAG: cobalamin biosynthesis protein CobD [Lachnospiraceae bacterium]|uniref:Cobalamin biosynthesis protein CobD n=1 Tax=Candidatus Weimeria bifida TaxID=2599074 RepID=A0A6N7IYP6_9FIRM|nr:cobalamin biosynthesis protein CobD [Candidatus Weimeria bifida]RRF97215.1 MAG: cobalamin biosynthesis protein CobD [Lachnospiraceae bacterium]